MLLKACAVLPLTIWVKTASPTPASFKGRIGGLRPHTPSSAYLQLLGEQAYEPARLALRGEGLQGECPKEMFVKD